MFDGVGRNAGTPRKRHARVFFALHVDGEEDQDDQHHGQENDEPQLVLVCICVFCVCMCVKRV